MDRLDASPSPAQYVARSEVDHIIERAETPAGCLLGPLGHIERQAELPLIDAGTVNMVPVIMADYDGVTEPDVATGGRQSLLGSTAGDAGVEE